MRLSNLQAMMLLQIARDTAVIGDKQNIFTFNREQRLKLIEEIMNQQSRSLIELEVDDLVPIHENQQGLQKDES